jgi:hypothetical protein
MERVLKAVSIYCLAVVALFATYSLASAQGVNKSMVKKAKSKVDKAKVQALGDQLEDAITRSLILKKENE